MILVTISQLWHSSVTTKWILLCFFHSNSGIFLMYFSLNSGDEIPYTLLAIQPTTHISFMYVCVCICGYCTSWNFILVSINSSRFTPPFHFASISTCQQVANSKVDANKNETACSAGVRRGGWCWCQVVWYNAKSWKFTLLTHSVSSFE